MALDNTQFAGMMKDYFLKLPIVNIDSPSLPFSGMIQRNTKAAGDNWTMPVEFRNPNNIDSNLGSIKGGTIANGGYGQFLGQYYKVYNVVSIDGLTLGSSNSTEGAFKSAKVEIINAKTALQNAIEAMLFRGLQIGQVDASTTLGSATLQLKDKGDAKLFYAGQVLRASANLDGSSPRTGTITVSTVNLDSGQVVMTGNLNAGISAIASQDYLFRQYSVGLTTPFTGVQSYLSLDASPAALHGLTRTTDTTRLAGWNVNATGKTVLSAFQTAVSKSGTFGDQANVIFCSRSAFDQAVQESGSQVQYTSPGGVAKVGFASIEIAGGTKVVQSAYCPDSEAYALAMSTWQLLSVGDAPRIRGTAPGEDGLVIRSDATADTWTSDLLGYIQLVCSAPGRNVRIYNMPSLS